jgi:nucleoside-diphosphate-sugar epimerase
MTITQKLVGRRALVTGASGFIGSALCHRLVQAGAIVHGVSRSDRTTSADGVAWHRCALEDAAAVRALLARIRPDLIFHLASHVAGSRAVELVLPTFHGNLTSTVNLLTAATELGCGRVVLTGSMEEPEPGPDWPVPSSPYAAAKYAASAYGRMFHALYQTPVVTLRVFMVYGPGQRDVKKLIPYVTLSLLKGETPQISSGVRQVDWIYVDDVIEAYLAAALADGAQGKTVEVGTGKLVSVRGVVEQLFELIRPGVTPVFGSITDRPMEQVRAANVEASLHQIGWRAQTVLRDGLERTVRWYRECLDRGVH